MNTMNTTANVAVSQVQNKYFPTAKRSNYQKRSASAAYVFKMLACAPFGTKSFQTQILGPRLDEWSSATGESLSIDNAAEFLEVVLGACRRLGLAYPDELVAQKKIAARRLYQMRQGIEPTEWIEAMRSERDENTGPQRRTSPLNRREARFYDECLGRQWIPACQDCSRLWDLLVTYNKHGKVYPEIETLMAKLGWKKWRVERTLKQLKKLGAVRTHGRMFEHGPMLRTLHAEVLTRKKLPPWPRELRPSERKRANVESQVSAPVVHSEFKSGPFLVPNVESQVSGHVGPQVSGTSNNRRLSIRSKAVAEGKSKAAAEGKSTAAAAAAEAYVFFEGRFFQKLSEKQRLEYVLAVIWIHFNGNYPGTLSKIARRCRLHRRQVKPILQALAADDYPNGLYMSENGKKFWPITPDDPHWDEYEACCWYDEHNEETHPEIKEYKFFYDVIRARMVEEYEQCYEKDAIH